MEKFKFTPEQGFRDGTAFPNPTSETDIRNQLQTPLDQLKDYVNQLLGIIPTDEQLQQIVNNHELIQKIEKTVKELEENSNSVADFNEETGELTINSSKAINAVIEHLCNPNLLMNSDFRNPVNQRGETMVENTSANEEPFIDRWLLQNWINAELVETGIKLSCPTDSRNKGRIIQKFITKLPKDTYTLSINVLAATGTMLVYLSDGTEIGSITTTGLNTFRIPNCNMPGIRLILEQDADFIIEYVKLEKGDIATPFTPRTYEEEFIACQKYHIEDLDFVLKANSEASTYYWGHQIPLMAQKNPTIILKTLTESSGDNVLDKVDSITLKDGCLEYIRLTENVGFIIRGKCSLNAEAIKEEATIDGY